MTNILIAVDESEEAVFAVESAHKLFGDDAHYFVVNVSAGLSSAPFSDGYVYPIVPPYTGTGMMGVQPIPAPGSLSKSSATATENNVQVAKREADDIAAGVAGKASLATAETIGEVGDPADSIIEAARLHGIDVIVVGSHERSWFSRLVSGSVSNQVVKQSTIPVLVIK